MWWSLVGAAWAWEPAEPATVPIGPIDAVAVGAVVVAAGPQGTYVVREGAASRVGDPAVALAVADVDQDGRDDVLVCGAGGVWWVDGVGAALPKLADTSCTAIAASDGAVALAGPDGIARRPLTRAGLGPAAIVAPPLEGALVAVLLDRVAIARRGGEGVTEVSDRGASTFATRGPVADLRVWDGRFAWSLPEAAVVADPSGHAVPVAPLPGPSAVARVEGVPAWFALHGPDRLGVVRDGEERVFAVPAARAVGAGDLDGDACADVALGTESGVVLLAGKCAPPVATAPVAPPVGPPPRPPRRFRFDDCTAMAGLAGGGTYSTSWSTVGEPPFTPSVSPAVAIACELDGPLRLYGGLDSAVAFRYSLSDDVRGSHILGASGGFLYGKDRFRIGPIGTLGTVVLGVGARALWLPFGGDGRTLRGFEVRALALPSPGPVPSLEVMAMYGVELREFR